MPTRPSAAVLLAGIIGKKHVGPEAVYPFDFAYTEENNSIMQVGRNITRIKELVRLFFSSNDTRPFFLYVTPHDPHRCGANPQYGAFCERFGGGQPGMGIIPDWKPAYYSPNDVIVPYFVQDTPAVREDIAKQYTTISRLDQGIGLILHELELAGHKDDTLVIFTSDNGIPFPYGRTNVNEPGIKEPFLISSPLHKGRFGQIPTRNIRDLTSSFVCMQETDALVTHLDIVPTVLDWFDIEYPKYSLNGQKAQLSGNSILPLLETEPSQGWDTAFASHQNHEITMYYPMRAIRTKKYKLILNLNYRMPFPIDMDFATSATFRDLLNRTENHQPLHWFSTLDKYYYRKPCELFDIERDPHELNNVCSEKTYAPVLNQLLTTLRPWQHETNDPWRCAPYAVLGYDGKCEDLYNGLPRPASPRYNFSSDLLN